MLAGTGIGTAALMISAPWSLCYYAQFSAHPLLRSVLTSPFPITGAVQSGVGCAYSDVSPNYSSSLNSVGNTIGAIAGIAGPLIVSACLDENPGIVGWRVAFFITAGFAAIALAFWSKLQTSKIVDVLNTPCAKEDSCF